MKFVVAMTVVLTLSFAAVPVFAANQFFTDAGGPNPWDNATMNWSNASGGPYNVTWGAFNDAVFEGTGGVVNVNAGPENANSLTFNANGYNLTGGVIQIGNPTTPAFYVVDGAMATIGSGLTKAGTNTIHFGKSGYAGKLILSGAGNFQANQFVIDAGTVQLDGRTITATVNNTNRAVNVNAGTLTLNTGGIAFTGGNAGMMVGDAGAGVFNQTGGTVNVSGTFGLWIADGTGSSGTLNLSGGTFTSTAGTTVLATRGTGILNVSGTAAVTLSTLQFGHTAGSNQTSTVNLNGGSLTLDSMNKANASDTATFNFNGGTLKARSTNAAFMSGLSAANVQSGGAIIDTNGFNITIAQALLNGGGGGGLTKLGAGTLTLTSSNTYTGDTTISAGTLSINQTYLADLANVLVASGATFNLNFGGIDTIGALFLNGVQQAAGTWGASGSGATHINDTFFSGTGRLLVTVAAVPTPAALPGGLALLMIAAMRRRKGMNRPSSSGRADKAHDRIAY
ncbi:MAG: hypothetical protein GC162_00380 [Planctomycetes bacterium]|nr:hypothetical protein [Planctomycetota bacterium]